MSLFARVEGAWVPLTPGQQWPEEEAELVGVYTPSLAVLGVMTSGR